MNLTLPELRLTDIYEITLKIGDKIYLTPYGGTHTELPLVDGNKYTTVPIERGRVRYNTNLQVDTVDISMAVHGFTVRGKTIIRAANLGWFNGAEIIISMINPLNVIERREIFRGNLSRGIKIHRQKAKFSMASVSDMLNVNVPKFIYQELCNYKLWSVYCTLNKAAYLQIGTADAGSTQLAIIDAIFNFVTNPAGFFALGEIKMTSGENIGFSRTIRTQNNGNVVLYQPFDFPIALNDTFEVWPGCDKSGTTCDGKFANYLNFAGFEYIPRPEILF